jgi:hypothetical protein
MAIKSLSGSEAAASPAPEAGTGKFDPSHIRRLVRGYLLGGDRNESFLGLLKLSMAFSRKLFIEDKSAVDGVVRHQSAKADIAALVLLKELNKYSELDSSAVIHAIEEGKFDYILRRVQSRILSEIKVRQRRPTLVDIPPEVVDKRKGAGPPPQPPQDHDDDCNWQGASILLENAGYYIKASDPEAADILYALATDAYERYERFIERRDARLTHSSQKGK